MKPLANTHLTRVDTIDDVHGFRDWLGRDRQALSFDTETTGLKWYLPDFRIRLVQFGDCDDGYILRADRWGQVIEDVFAEYDGDFVSHNGPGYDGHVLRVAGLTLPRPDKWHDTLMQAKLIDPRGSHTLKRLTVEKFGPLAGVGEKLLDSAFKKHGYKDKGEGFAKIPYGVPAYDVYSGADAIIGARLHAEQWPVIQERYLDVYEEEMAAWWVTFEHEAKGLPVDLEWAANVKEEYETKLTMVGADLHAKGIKNPNSKTQRLQVLYTEGFVPEEFTESGEVKLDKRTLENFASPTALDLIEYGRIEHWLTAYIDKVLQDNYLGRVYPNFNPFGAKTGRQAAYGPPVQQLPGRHEDAYKIRGMFLPEEGHKLWSIDYDGEENRLAAHYSGDKALTKLILSGEDIHRYTASIVYGIIESEITADQRTIVKNTVYAEQYGAGLTKLGKMLNMLPAEVLNIKRGIEAAYPELTDYKRAEIAAAKQRYYDEGEAYALTWGGRRVYADQFDDAEPKFYTIVNYKLQGSGADVLKRAMNRVAADGLSHHIYLPMHDELLYSLPEGPEGRETADELARIMIFPTEFKVPLTCSPDGPFDRWSPH